jgi:AcrR family transcriptional regulator
VVARGLGRVADVGWDVLRRSSSVAEQIAGLVTALADFAAREAALTSILHREMADGGVRARPLAERFLTPLKDAAVNTLRAAQQRGEVRPVDPDLLVLHIAGAVIYPSLAAPLVQAVWGGDPQDPAFVERRKRALLDLLLPLVLVHPAG